MKRPTCETCAYWHIYEDQKILGNCKRNAPKPVEWPEGLDGGGYGTCWPETTDDDWCGEHPDFPDYLASLKAAK